MNLPTMNEGYDAKPKTISPSDASAGSDLRVGDSVTWMHCISDGMRMGFTTRRGKVRQIIGNFAQVKQRNGRQPLVALTSLRKEGQKTELTEMVEDMSRQDQNTEVSLRGADAESTT